MDYNEIENCLSFVPFNPARKKVKERSLQSSQNSCRLMIGYRFVPTLKQSDGNRIVVLKKQNGEVSC